VGTFEIKKAIFFAKDRGYDLVLVAPRAQPPVAKLLDYGKFKYQQEKLLQKQKKKSKVAELKEIRFSLKISPHDLEIKTKKALKFLEKGHKVRLNLRLMGREMQFQSKAIEFLSKIIEDLKEKGELETRPKREKNQFFAQIKPK